MEKGGKGTTGGETSKSHSDLAGGKGRWTALGSYRQSGGANGTRKTWGALVGETGRSHLTGTVTLGVAWGHSIGLGIMGRGGLGSIFKAAGKKDSLTTVTQKMTTVSPFGSRKNGASILRQKCTTATQNPSPVSSSPPGAFAGVEAPFLLVLPILPAT